MNTDIYKTIEENAKDIFLPPRKKRGEDTEILSNFIEDLTKLYQIYHHEGLTPFDSSHVLLEFSISTMMKLGHRAQLVDYGRHVKRAGDTSLKMLEQHTSLVVEQRED